MKSIDRLAKDCAADVLQAALAAGYAIKPDRDLFVVSDLSDLGDVIACWIEQHMQPGSEAT